MAKLNDLRWLISNSSLKNLRCIACPDMLDQTFDSVTILDNIEMLKWIRQHELVLTNGYLFLNQNKKEIYETIESLKKEGCAGLGIKIKNVFTDLPRDIIEAAVQYQLSIIEIPYFYSLS